MFEHVRTWFTILFDRRGVTAMEYGLIAALIAVVIIGAVTTVGSNLSNVFNNVSSALTTTTTKGTGS
jgi:pilus assembly protein Flp/PilA